MKKAEMKKSGILGLILLVIMSCSRPSQKQGGGENVIVSVGAGELTLADLNKAIPTSIRHTISQEQITNYIQQWIETELIYRDAIRLGLDKDQEVDIELQKAKREILMKKYLEKYIPETENISEDEAKGYYEDNKNSYILMDDEVKALYILVSAEEEAKRVYRRLINGEDFEAVAREVSKDYFDKKQIVLDYFKREDVIPEIATRVFSVNIGSITSPIHSTFGYHIFKILDRRKKGDYRRFEEVKEQIVGRLRSMKRHEKYLDLILELRNKTNIKRNIQLLQQFYSDSTFRVNHQRVNNSN